MALSPTSSRGVNPLANVNSVFARTGAVVAVNGDYSGVVAAALTGATQASRYVGATASGAPASGTFAIGDFVIDQTGKIYVCTTAGTPGTWTQVGGSAQPVTRGQYTGNATAVANNTSVDMPLNTLQLGTALLNLTTPTAPIVTAGGVYSIAVRTSPTANMTAGGIYTLSMDFDADGDDQSVSITAVASANLLQPPTLLELTYYIAAAGTLRFQVTNLDGVSSRTFSLGAYVQRLSGP